MPGSSTRVESPFASSICLKLQVIQFHLISLYLYNNAGITYFPITHSIHILQPLNLPSDYRFSFCLAFFFKKIDHNFIVWALLFLGKPSKFSKSESLVGFQFLEELAAKDKVTFFRGFQFLHKKLKSDIFNNKKSL